MAEAAQKELVGTAGRADRGVLQAGFWVLHASAMPAVLVELDFICNPECEKYLNSEKGKKQLARALYNAVCSYFGLLSQPSENSELSEPSEPSAEINPELTFRVQFIASDRKLAEPAFKGMEKVEYYQHGGLYKYTTGGDFKTEADAEKYAAQVRKKFPQAFIIKWQNGARVM